MKRRNFIKSVIGGGAVLVAPSLAANVVSSSATFESVEDYKGDMYDGEIGNYEGWTISPEAKDKIRNDDLVMGELTITGLSKDSTVKIIRGPYYFESFSKKGDDIIYQYDYSMVGECVEVIVIRKNYKPTITSNVRLNYNGVSLAHIQTLDLDYVL